VNLMPDKKNTALSEKQQYSIVLELKAPIQECFRAGYAEEAMQHWVPDYKNIEYDHSRAEVPYGPGAERLITQTSGKSIIERITRVEEPFLLGYEIPTFGAPMNKLIKNYRGEMHFEKIDDQTTRLTWQGYFASPMLVESLIRWSIRGVISKVANQIKTYLETAS
jgi:uncharacterized protein YndB with AHSA1/START domain